MPLTPGQCIEWDGGSRGFMRLLPGVKTKSRLTVTHGGGIYLGPDGVEVRPRNAAVCCETDMVSASSSVDLSRCLSLSDAM